MEGNKENKARARAGHNLGAEAEMEHPLGKWD